MAHGNAAPSAKPSSCPETAQRRIQFAHHCPSAPAPLGALIPDPARGFGQSHISTPASEEDPWSAPSLVSRQATVVCRHTVHDGQRPEPRQGRGSMPPPAPCRPSFCAASQDKPGNSVTSRDFSEYCVDKLDKATRKPPNRPTQPGTRTLHLPSFLSHPHRPRTAGTEKKPLLSTDQTPTRPDPAKARKQAGRAGAQQSKQPAERPTRDRPHALSVQPASKALDPSPPLCRSLS